MIEQLSDLAAKYVQQLAVVEDLRRTAKLAEGDMLREQVHLRRTEQTLKALINLKQPKLLTPIGAGTYVLIHNANGGFGIYASIDIIEEYK
jgi:prefoldin subunit 5